MNDLDTWAEYARSVLEREPHPLTDTPTPAGMPHTVERDRFGRPVRREETATEPPKAGAWTL